MNDKFDVVVMVLRSILGEPSWTNSMRTRVRWGGGPKPLDYAYSETINVFAVEPTTYYDGRSQHWEFYDSLNEIIAIAERFVARRDSNE